MTFTFSLWIALVEIVGIVTLCIAALKIFEARRGKERRKSVRNTIILFVIYGVVYNLGTFGLSHIPWLDKNRLVTDRVVAEQLFGFKANVAYPLVLGSQVSEFTASASASTGFFSSTADSVVRGGAAITVAFTSRGTTYTLSLPRNSSKIKIDDSARPTVNIHFYPFTHRANGLNRGEWSKCETVISNLALACQRKVTYSDELETSGGYAQAGLGKLVSDVFQSADLTMTSKMYNQLIGGIQN